jgi:hypothetical protein
LETQLKQYIATGDISPELEASFAEPSSRRQLYRLMVDEPAGPFRPLLVRLFEQEIQFRNALWNGEVADPADYFEGIYHSAFLLSRCGDPSDVPTLWRAQYLNQDIGELDVGNFVGAGVDRTLEFLAQQSGKEYSEIAEFIRESLSHPSALEWIQSWKEGCRASIGGT